jgi:hypothetical protein
MAITTTVLDYKTLAPGGGFAMDRPSTFRELMRALKARVQVAEEAGAAAEYFSSNGDAMSDEVADKIVESCRWLVAFPVVGNSEGYYIHVAALNDGRYTNLALIKVLGTREDVQRITAELNELLLRM